MMLYIKQLYNCDTLYSSYFMRGDTLLLKRKATTEN